MNSSRVFTAAAVIFASATARLDAQSARPVPPPPRAAAVSEVPPAGATGRCQDGSFTTAQSVASDCATRGGMLVSFPVRQVPARLVTPLVTAADGAASVPALRKPVAAERLQPLSPAAAVEVPKSVGGANTPAPVRAGRSTSSAVAPTMSARPANATGQCKDGSYVVGATEGSCGANGGIAVTFPARRPASPRGG